MHRLHEVLLLRDDLLRELVTGPAVLGVVRVILVVHVIRESRAFLVELLLGADHALHLGDRVFHASLRFVPEKLGIAVGDVAVVTGRANAGAIVVVRALLILLRDPLHGVACAAAECIGAGCRDADLRPDHHRHANKRSDDQQPERRSSCIPAVAEIA